MKNPIFDKIITEISSRKQDDESFVIWINWIDWSWKEI